jgi:hypothetical protein
MNNDKLLQLIDKQIKLEEEKKYLLQNLLDTFDTVDFTIEEEKFTPLFTWSENNLRRLNEIVASLSLNNLLNATSFDAAVIRLLLKVPAVEKSNVTVATSVVAMRGELRREVQIQGGPRFFVADKMHDKGSFGEIRKAYENQHTRTISYVVKTIPKNEEEEEFFPELEAQREAKFHRFLGRNAFYFSEKNDVAKVVSDWQNVCALHYISISELKRNTYATRLQCLISGLNELEKLHAHYRVHGDIKPLNCIVDLPNKAMHLIDLASTHKKGSQKAFAATPKYSDQTSSSEDNYSFCDDVYSMGIVAASLFPELFTIQEDNSKITAIPVEKQFSLIETSLVTVIDSMLAPIRETRCTSVSALHYCQELLKHLPVLNETILQTIRSSTLAREETTVEDVFRGSIRRSYF